MNYRVIFTWLFVMNAVYAEIPIVYHKKYDISFLGIEKFHPFDTHKYSKIDLHIRDSIGLFKSAFPTLKQKITDAELMKVHTKEYLDSLSNSAVIAQVSGLLPLAMVPNFLLQWRMIDSIRYATAGTILAAELALKHGWAINLGGGYHHAKSHKGDGFCFFADIPLAVLKIREKMPQAKVLIVDLDAHQGNGVEEMLAADPHVFIFDMFSQNNYPMETRLYPTIDFMYPLRDYIDNSSYLAILKENLPQAIEQVKPDFIIYNAGSDIFERDQLGKICVTREGVIERDHFVFAQAFAQKIPILMLLSGGYSSESAGIVGASIVNVIQKFNLVPIGRRLIRPKSIKIRKGIK